VPWRSWKYSEGLVVTDRVGRDNRRIGEVGGGAHSGRDGAVIEQEAEVGGIGFDQIAVAAVGREVESNRRDERRRTSHNHTVVCDHRRNLAELVDEHHVLHAAASGLAWIIRERTPPIWMKPPLFGLSALGEFRMLSRPCAVVSNAISLLSKRSAFSTSSWLTSPPTSGATLDTVPSELLMIVPICARMPPPFLIETTACSLCQAQRIARHIGIGIGRDIAEVGFLIADLDALRLRDRR